MKNVTGNRITSRVHTRMTYKSYSFMVQITLHLLTILYKITQAAYIYLLLLRLSYQKLNLL